MDIFFTEPGDAPVPPDEMRIRELKAEPYPDGHRIKVYLEVTPFQHRPVGELVIWNDEEQAVAFSNIVEPLENKIEITMHLRSQETAGNYRLQAKLMYREAIQPPEEEDEEAELPPLIEVDQAEFQFSIS